MATVIEEVEETAGGAATTDAPAMPQPESANELTKAMQAASTCPSYQEWLPKATTALRAALALNNEEAPEKNPFVHKYVARQSVEMLVATTHVFQTTDRPDEPTSEHITVTRAFLLYHVGCICVEVEELADGEQALNASLTTLQAKAALPRCIVYYLAVLNQLGILWAGRMEHQKALEYFDAAASEFTKFKSSTDASEPTCDLKSLVADQNAAAQDASKENFLGPLEEEHTQTSFYLAQCYGQTGDGAKSAQYAHITLRRQFETNRFEPMEWATHCAAIAQYYLSKRDYAQSRHCLASASKVSGQCEATTEEEREQHAAIAICWVKYFVQLLQESGELLQLNEKPKQCDTDKVVRFESLELPDENECPVTHATSYDEALQLFLRGQRWVNKALAVYTLDGHVSHHVTCTQDWSALYKYLVVFEKDIDNCSKMTKKRIDLLTNVVNQLSPQYYLLICRQLDWEIAQAYAELATFKEERAKVRNRASKQDIAKMNRLRMSAKQFYEKFLDSLKSNTGEVPDKYEAEVDRPAIVAHFWIARMLTKLVVPPPEHLKALQESVEHYKTIIAYCEKHEDFKPKVQEEYDISKEIVPLLVAKAANIQSGIQKNLSSC